MAQRATQINETEGGFTESPFKTNEAAPPPPKTSRHSARSRMSRSIEEADMRLLLLMRAAGADGTTQRELQKFFKPKPIIHRMGELINAGSFERVETESDDDADVRAIDRVFVLTRGGIDTIKANSHRFPALMKAFEPKPAQKAPAAPIAASKPQAAKPTPAPKAKTPQKPAKAPKTTGPVDPADQAANSDEE